MRRSDRSDGRLSPRIIAVVYQHSIFSPVCPVDVAFLYENLLVICPCSTFNHPLITGVRTVYCKNPNQFQIISHKNTSSLRSAAICWYYYWCKAPLKTGCCLQGCPPVAGGCLLSLDQILHSFCDAGKDFNSVKIKGFSVVFPSI